MTVTTDRQKGLHDLPVKYREIIAGGADWGQYGYASKFAARKAIVCAAVRAGFDHEDCYRTFLSDPTSPGFMLWDSDRRDIGHGGRVKRLIEDYAQAFSYCEKNRAPVRSTGDARAEAGEMIALAATAEWKGAAGRTDRDVLAVAHEIATEYGSLSVMLPARDVALKAGCSFQTVSRSLERLVRAGWLKRAVRIAGWLTGCYVLRMPAEVTITETYKTASSTPDMSQKQSPAHEVWVKLGKSARAVWLALDSDPCSGREIARRAGVCQETARKALKSLETGELAASGSEGWIRGSATPDEVAERYGFDVVAQRAKRYDADRKAWNHDVEVADIETGGHMRKRSRPAVITARSERIRISHPDAFVTAWNRAAYKKRDKAMAA